MRVIAMLMGMFISSAMAGERCEYYDTGESYCIVTGPMSESHTWTNADGTTNKWGKVCWTMHGTLNCIDW